MPEPEWHAHACDSRALRPEHSQDRHPVRLEWGADGALALTRHAIAGGARVYAVVVDVLSFTTSVSVAADAGLRVLPYRWGREAAQDFADDRSAVLAQPRSGTRPGGISLSPRSIRNSQVTGAIVLPSPNGSTIAERLAESGAVVLVGALRNRAAVGRWLAQRPGILHAPPHEGGAAVVLLVPAGERWPDGSLRLAVEDLWGAGGVAAALVEQLVEPRGGNTASGLLSPEAETARLAFVGVRGRLADELAACASGRELIDSGWPDDVAIAGELDASSSVPVLTEGAFSPGRDRAGGRAEP